MKWKVNSRGPDGYYYNHVVEADTLDVRDGLLVFGRGKLVCDHVPILILNRDAWNEVAEVKEETP